MVKLELLLVENCVSVGGVMVFVIVVIVIGVDYVDYFFDWLLWICYL